MNIARGNKGVNSRSSRPLDGIPRPRNILLIGPTQPRNDGDVPVLEHLVPHHIGDLFDGVEVVRTGDGEAGLDDVHAEFGKVARYFEFFLGGECGARGLLSIAEGGVEYADVVGVGDAVGDVLGAGAAFVEFSYGGVYRGGCGCKRGYRTAVSPAAGRSDRDVPRGGKGR